MYFDNGYSNSALSLSFYAPVLGYRSAIGTEERSDDLGPVRVYMITLWIRRKQ